MFLRVSRTGVVVAALFCVLTLAAPALAQGPFSAPVLRDRPEGGFSGGQATPTPTPTASPTATPKATATPGHRRDQLADTGADPLRLALAGLAMLGLGMSLRFRVARADTRR